MLTLEARPKVGADQYLPVEGVTMHVVDQRMGACDDGTFYGSCPGAARRHQQVPYVEGDDDAHVVPVGGSATVNGVTVTVTGRIGNAFTVQVSGAFTAGAASPHAFAPTSLDARAAATLP